MYTRRLHPPRETPTLSVTRDSFDADRAAGLAETIEARLAWLAIEPGDVLFASRRDCWVTGDGHVVPGWAIRHHWGSAFVPIGWRPPPPRQVLRRTARFLCRRTA